MCVTGAETLQILAHGEVVARQYDNVIIGDIDWNFQGPKIYPCVQFGQAARLRFDVLQ